MKSDVEHPRMGTSPPRVNGVGVIFGISGRRALKLYTLSVATVMALFLVIAWSIDLAENFDDVVEVAARNELNASWLLARYLVYRMADIVTRLLPVACFIGLFIAEMWRTIRLESTIMAASGWSPVQTLLVVTIFGVGVGALQFSLERDLRPAAIFAQVDLETGSYARRFKRGVSDEARWFVVGRDILRAHVKSDGEPEFRDLELYRGAGKGDLQDVVVAERAIPTDRYNIWQLRDAYLWARLPGRPSAGDSRPASDKFFLVSRYATLELEIDLLPVQLEYHGVPAFYLPEKALRELEYARHAVKESEVSSARARRTASAVLPGSFALLGASLAPLAGSGRVRSVWKMLMLLLCGYAALVTLKVFWALGELGAVSAPVSAWFAVVAALAGTLAATWWQARLR
ncbi:LptF/LptG family permease [Stappia sp. GBMRC 2046]|uniref:LptF/LptG family permease n=1 Tax=Stappia sediminis TaxID=2692190 RepID=A0A7X3LT73_9HYPH|nr:LptF/LptG family permease [Stappia sediminis]MXN64641.1 LptF/LptG family permease [Stappia sediminis]